MTSPGYLRFPHIHGDIVAFVADDDVWLAPATGGRAWRVSADHAGASHPRISRDGTTVAWTSGRDGPPEVYLAGIDGGNGRRLSYWGDRRTRVCGWTPDGDVVAITASGQPFDHFTWAYALSVGAPAGPVADPLPFGPVTDLAVEADGVALLSGASRSDPALWKRAPGARPDRPGGVGHRCRGRGRTGDRPRWRASGGNAAAAARGGRHRHGGRSGGRAGRQRARCGHARREALRRRRLLGRGDRAGVVR